MRINWTYTLVLSALVAVAGWLWYLDAMHNRGGPERLWFYDLNMGNLFAAPIDQLPPIAAPSGDLRDAPAGTPAGVLAQVTLRQGKRHIVYLQTWTSEGRRYMETARERIVAIPEEDLARMILVAPPPEVPGTPVTWVAIGSPAGQAITAAATGAKIDLPH